MAGDSGVTTVEDTEVEDMVINHTGLVEGMYTYRFAARHFAEYRPQGSGKRILQLNLDDVNLH